MWACRMTQQKQGRSNQCGFPPAGINHCNYKSKKLLQGSNGSENSKQQWQIIKEKRSGLRPSFTFKKFQGPIAKLLFSLFFFLPPSLTPSFECHGTVIWEKGSAEQRWLTKHPQQSGDLIKEERMWSQGKHLSRKCLGWREGRCYPKQGRQQTAPGYDPGPSDVLILLLP